MQEFRILNYRGHIADSRLNGDRTHRLPRHCCHPGGADDAAVAIAAVDLMMMLMMTVRASMAFLR